MPMPVSLTLNLTQVSSASLSRLTVMEMIPCSVNLLALLSRLSKHWRSLVTSARV